MIAVFVNCRSRVQFFELLRFRISESEKNYATEGIVAVFINSFWPGAHTRSGKRRLHSPQQRLGFNLNEQR